MYIVDSKVVRAHSFCEPMHGGAWRATRGSSPPTIPHHGRTFFLSLRHIVGSVAVSSNSTPAHTASHCPETSSAAHPPTNYPTTPLFPPTCLLALAITTTNMSADLVSLLLQFQPDSPQLKQRREYDQQARNFVSQLSNVSPSHWQKGADTPQDVLTVSGLLKALKPVC
jgi:hypothetical protein